MSKTFILPLNSDLLTILPSWFVEFRSFSYVGELILMVLMILPSFIS